ncbi:MAG: HNH endonuclease [Dehalococcoidia bacterium]|nr:HNH endonuclease [Dehalococcoidia bacterium]
MAIASKLRFEVFKRNNFTCRYGGRKTPQIVLEVDHVIPVAKGGGDEIENLVTSCYECNRGKGASLLSDEVSVSTIHENTVLLLERELQLKEYNGVKRSVREREDQQIDELLQFWDDLFHGPPGMSPGRASLRLYPRPLPAEDIKDAMEITSVRKGGNGAGVHYLYGILKDWANDRQRPVEIGHN